MNLLKIIANRFIKPSQPITGRFWFTKDRTAGERITEDTAMTYSAVWRAVSIISETVASLPWAVYQKNNGIRETLSNHPAQRLISLQPNGETDAFAFKQVLCAHALTFGNGFAEIERDRSNTPRALWQIEPDRVQVERDRNGNIVYIVSNGSAPRSVIPQRDMFHVKGLGYDGIVGYSVISYAARSIGSGIATDQFGADFFANGAQESGALEHPGRLSPQAIQNLIDSVQDQTTGRNKHKPLVLEEGAKWSRRTIPPEDAQFLETKKFNVTDIARWFGVPPHKLMEMEQATFSNIEHQNIEFVTDAIMSWVLRFEMEANIKLISPAQNGRVYTKMNLNSLLRGDTTTRANFYKEMWSMGAYTPNRILELEDENPIGPEGDKALVQLNLTTLDKVGEDDRNATTEPQVENTAASASNDENEDENEALSNEARTILAEAFGRVVARQEQRISDAAQRHGANSSEFKKYIAKFRKDHEKYMMKALEVSFSVYLPDVPLKSYVDVWCDELEEKTIDFNIDIDKELESISTI